MAPVRLSPYPQSRAWISSLQYHPLE